MSVNSWKVPGSAPCGCSGAPALCTCDFPMTGPSHPMPSIPCISIRQPTNPRTGTREVADIQPVGEKEGRRLWTMHRLGVVEFLNPEGFGYIRGKDQVAGFQPHLFRRVPTFPPREGGDSAWVVERLELVSLLMHETPVVYVSEHLPR